MLHACSATAVRRCDQFRCEGMHVCHRHLIKGHQETRPCQRLKKAWTSTVSFSGTLKPATPTEPLVSCNNGLNTFQPLFGDERRVADGKGAERLLLHGESSCVPVFEISESTWVLDAIVHLRRRGILLTECDESACSPVQGRT